MAIRPPDIEAEISFITTENGGRRSAVISGYRPNHDFGFGEMLDAAHEYPDCESVAPGQKAKTSMWFLAPLYRADSLRTGMKFTVQEGDHVVGHGVVTKIMA
jgi:translation elongation factor EF-Tu-like GTPase